VLHRYTGQTDIVVGTPVANRTRVETEGLIGFFVNMLVLRTDLAGSPTFREALRRVRGVALDAYAHQDAPFEKLVEVLQPVRDPSRTPVFQVMFTLQNSPGEALTLPGLTLTALPAHGGTAKTDLSIQLGERPDGLWASVEYCSDLFEPETIRRLWGHYETVLTSAAADPGQPIGVLPMLRADERRQLLVDWNATATGYPRQRTIHELFTAAATAHPDRIALAAGERTVTYRALDQGANHLARRLHALGAQPGTVVAVWLERSVELVVTLLAVLKTGAAYLPLDLAAPPERLAFMLGDAGVDLVVTDTRLADRLPAAPLRTLCLDSGAFLEPDAPDAPGVSVGMADDLAYVMYTSGSTGGPKGVLVPHRAVVRLVKDTDYVAFGADEVFLQLAPASFDASTFEIWGSLLNGARLAIFPPEPPTLGTLGDALARHGVTTLWLTAGLFHQVVDERPEILAPLRQLLAGGDVLSVAHVRRILDLLPGLRLVNGYGPTENTTFTCCYPVSDPAALERSVPIGRPIANTRVYVLDEGQQPVPVGVPGELCAAGDGLALGYLNQPELTAARFVPSPLVAGERLYRTGDIVRYRPDGTLEFIGRADQQVKIRGYRIELGEVEAALARHPGLRDVVVHAVADETGGRRLVAHVVATEGCAPTPSELRAFVTARLPEYMVPSLFVTVPRLPLTANGKVDRAALPAASARVRPDASDRPTGDELQLRLTEIWEQTLGVQPIGDRDNFFDLGGHSLLAVRLFARIERTLGRRLPLAMLFEAPTIGEMAARLRQEGWTAPWRSLVGIQPRGSRPPLFAVPGVFGGVVFFSDLARLLGPDQPFYGLQARGLDGREPPFASIAEMAAHYVEEIRHVQPHGPYALLGACMGGVVAYEMAQQLRALGESVSFLALLETYQPAPRRVLAAPSGAAYRRTLVRFMLGRFVSHFRTLTRLEAGERWQYLRRKARVLRERLSRRDPLEGARTEIYQAMVVEASSRAFARYAAQPYAGSIVLFLAGGRPLRPDDRRLRWREVTGGGFHVHVVPGADTGLTLAEPNVRVLARRLQRCLDCSRGAAASEPPG
jgi:aspartate racemase